MKRIDLIIHKDGPPEFREVEGKSIRYPIGGKTPKGYVDYPSLGKLLVLLSENQEENVDYVAEMRMFVHPDIKQEIELRGRIIKLHVDPETGERYPT